MIPRSIIKRIIPETVFSAIEPYGHLAESVILNTIHGFPAHGLKVIGVTGTNGKTSTAFLIFRMLRTAGYNVGLMTTVAYGANEDIKPQVQHMTNVAVPELMRRLKELRSNGIEWLVLETTSHALAQNRVWGVPYSIVVMTNVTHEHLDYHKTFERYRDAKRKLFILCNRNKKGKRIGIINADDKSARLFSSDIAHPITYGIGKGDVRATRIRMTPESNTFRATVNGEQYNIVCHLPGSFNVYNSLAAIGVGRALGLTKDQIEKGIAALPGVEGRMTTIEGKQKFSVIVDFAHTPDSFEKLFRDMKPLVKGKMIVVFGSAGRRDEAKRAIQGSLAGEYCDEVILTEEDDRDVDGTLILEEIARGAEASGKIRGENLFLVHDRTEAITFAIKRAKSGDTVLLLGKGHEKTIERADGEHAWDEIGTASRVLRRLNNGH